MAQVSSTVERLWTHYLSLKQLEAEFTTLAAGSDPRYLALRDNARLITKNAEEIVKNQAELRNRLVPPLPIGDPKAIEARRSEMVDELHASYARLVEANEELVGPYVPPQEWVDWRYRLLALVVAGLLIIFVLIPLGYQLSAGIAYVGGLLAERSGDWTTAIEQFGYAYDQSNVFDSQQRLSDSYSAAIQVQLNAGNWEAARSLARTYIVTDIDPDRARTLLADSYFLPALAAYDRQQFPESIQLLDQINPPLSENQELLYKQDLVGAAAALSTSATPDWVEVENLMREYLLRPTSSTREGQQLDQQVYDLLSRSYTERARVIMDDTSNANRWQEARTMLQPAFVDPVSRSDNLTEAQKLIYDSYYRPAEIAWQTRDFRTARDQIQTLLSIRNQQHYNNSRTILFDTYYLTAAQLISDGKAASQQNDYVAARTNYDAARTELQGLHEITRQEPYNDSYTLLADTYYLPAVDLLNSGQYVEARQQFQLVLGLDRVTQPYAETYNLLRETYYRPGNTLLDAGDYAAARQQFQTLVRLDPAQDPYLNSDELLRETYYRPAQNQIARGDYVDARPSLDALIRLDGLAAAYKDTRKLLQDTYLLPAQELIIAGATNDQNYVDARTLLLELYARDREVKDPVSVAYRSDAIILFRQTYTLPAVALLTQPEPIDRTDYELARGLLVNLFTADSEASTTSILLLPNALPKRLDALLLDTYIRPALDLLNQEAPVALRDYEAARNLLIEAGDLDSAGGAYRYQLDGKSINDLFRYTYILPAIALLKQPSPISRTDYEAARDLLDSLLTADPDSASYTYDSNRESVRDLYYSTYIRPAVDYLNQDEPIALPDYESARDLLNRLLAADPDSASYTDGSTGVSVRDLYRSTYVRPALDRLTVNEPTEADYLDARLLLRTLLQEDQSAENYRYTTSDTVVQLLDSTYSRLAGSILGTDPQPLDYLLARGIYRQLLFVDYPGRYFIRADIVADYHDTYVVPATQALRPPVGTPDYETARTELYTLLYIHDPNSRENAGIVALFRRAYLDEASENLDAGDDSSARTLLESLFRIDPDSQKDAAIAETYFAASLTPAQSIYVKGDYISAAEAFRRLIPLADSLNLADSQRQVTDAYYESTYRRVQSLLVRDQFVLARSLLDSLTVGQADTVQPADDTDVRRSPNYQKLYAQTFYLPAKQFFDAGQYLEARAIFEELIRQSIPANVQVELPNWVESTATAIGDLSETTAFLYRQTYLQQGLLLAGDGDYSGAQVEFRALIALSSGGAPLYSKALPLQGAEISQIVPAFFIPAQEAYLTGDFRTAADLLREVDALDENYPGAALLLTESYRALIEEQLALRAFDRALMLYDELKVLLPDSEGLFADLLAQVLYERATQAFADGRYEDALADARQIYEQTPDYSDIATFYRNIYYIPAVEQLEQGRTSGDVTLCTGARTALQAMQAAVPGDFRDTETRINESYLCELEVAIAQDDLTNARQALDVLRVRSPFYRDVEDMLRRAYYEPAQMAIAAAENEGGPDQWLEARGYLEDLLSLEPYYSRDGISAFTLLRNTYYVPALVLFNAGSYAEARSWIDSLAVGTTGQPAIDPAYRTPDPDAIYTAADLYVESFLREGQAALDQGDWSTAQIRLGELVAINPNDPQATQKRRESYFLPGWLTLNDPDKGDEKWDNARRQFDALLRIDPDAQYFILPGAEGNVKQLRLETYMRPAVAAFENHQYSKVREYLAPLVGTAQPTIDYIDLAGNSAREIYRASFYNEATDALANQNYTSARTLLDDLFRYDRDYRDVTKLRIEVYLSPAKTAFEAGSWEVARQNFATALQRQYLEADRLERRAGLTVNQSYEAWFASPDPATLPAVRETAQTERTAYRRLYRDLQQTERLLVASYRLPIQDAIATEDWETARSHLTAWGSQLSAISTGQSVEKGLHFTYRRPFELAVEQKNFSAARAALALYEQRYPDERAWIASQRRETYALALYDALVLGDWFSAAQQYLAWSGELPDDRQTGTTLNTYPELVTATARQNSSFWGALPAVPTARIAYAGPITDAAFSTGGQRLATTGIDGVLTVWDLAVPAQIAPVFSVQTDEAYVSALVYAPPQPDQVTWIATAGISGDVVIYDATTGERISVLRDAEAGVNALAVTPDAGWLAAGGDDKQVYIWNTADWRGDPIIIDARLRVTALAFSPVENKLVIALANGDIAVWDWTRQVELYRIDGSTYIEELVFRPGLAQYADVNLQQFAAVGHSSILRVYRLSDGSTAQELNTREDWLRSAAFTGDGSLMLTLDAAGTVTLWDTLPEKWVRNQQITNYEGATVARFSLDSKALVLPGAADDIALWLAPLPAIK